MEEPARSRRATVVSLIATGLAAVGLWRFLTPRGGATAAAGSVAVPEADVPADGALVLPQHRCAIVRSGGSLLAFDLTCTHLGCTVKATAQGFACPCHGSRFDTGGEVVKGPASRPLRRLAVESRGGTIRVRRG
jgi:cytochrome b6-f complex iron-sulfur subunit